MTDSDSPGGVPQGGKGPAQVKSLADVMGVVNKAFPSHGDYVGPPVGQTPASVGRAADLLEVVGGCPKCGAPIYGKRVIDRGVPAAEYPPVKHTCSCHLYQTK